MKKKIFYSIALLACCLSHNVFAQRDIIYKTDSTQLRCKILKATTAGYTFAYADAAGKVVKDTIEKNLVDSICINYYSSNLVQNRIFKTKAKLLPEQTKPALKKWVFGIGVGLDIGSVFDLNSPAGADKKSLSGNCSIDATANYNNESSTFAASNELHYIFGIQKSELSSAAHLQRVTDNLATLHDFGVAIGKSKKWRVNVIVRFTTSLFTIYNGDYFKDINGLGKSQAFLSPYDITVSPGIKWQPNRYLRISISPYSFNLYGVTDAGIAEAGIFISETDGAGKYKRSLLKRLGAEVNIWYDKNINNWLELQYRLGISSNYFEKIARNGLMDGLFITRLKLLKNLFLTHRAVLRGDFSQRRFKPYYSQAILLNYAIAF